LDGSTVVLLDWGTLTGMGPPAVGWEKALGATSDDPATRARERAGLAWWWARAAEALEQWSAA
ncbi:MAG: hypothetical protein LC792_00390, partial [Actinobacteria bacterium]|nr:hypothetical protein [Actinomycetota bacterium]